MAAVDDIIVVLAQIARGRGDSGRPLAGETARQLARDVLIKHGITWPRQRDPGKEVAERTVGLTLENGDLS